MAQTGDFVVFVSHGADDSWVARQMARRIQEDCGAATFLDVNDVAAGDNFKQRVQLEIRKAKELIALFTPWSVKRPWVWIEIGGAWAQEKRVLALLHGLSTTHFERAAVT